MTPGERYGVGYMWVFVDVEYAPNLVVRTPTTALRLSRLAALSANRVFDQLERAATKWIDGDEDAISISAPPVREIKLLGAQTLDEDEHLKTLRGRGNMPRGRSTFAQDLSPVAISWAVSANCWSERMGVAP